VFESGDESIFAYGRTERYAACIFQAHFRDCPRYKLVALATVIYICFVSRSVSLKLLYFFYVASSPGYRHAVWSVQKLTRIYIIGCFELLFSSSLRSHY